MQFCSPLCRKRHQRWLLSLNTSLATAKRCIDVLGDAARFPEVSNQSLKRLKLLSQRINEHIQVASISTKKE
jgi:hypothetical protein